MARRLTTTTLREIEAAEAAAISSDNDRQEVRRTECKTGRPEEERQRILKAIETGDAIHLQALLVHTSIDVNQSVFISRSACIGKALHVAAEMGHLEIVRLLIEHKVEVGAKNLSGQTPLGIAAYEGHTAIVEFLLSQHNGSLEEELVLHAACSGSCCLDTIALLVGWLPEDAKRLNESVDLPLHCACRNSDLSVQVLCHLLKSFPNSVHQRNHRGMAPLNLLLGTTCRQDPQSSFLNWLRREDGRTILSLKQDPQEDVSAQRARVSWDLVVSLLWYHYYGFDMEEDPPRIADMSRVSDEEFKERYKWLVYAACSLIHVDGLFLDILYDFYDGDVALEACTLTQQTPLITALDALQRHLTNGIDHAELEPRILALLRWNPMACCICDVHERMPLAYAIQAGLPWSIIDTMAKAWPSSVLEKDVSGRFMFELACFSDYSVSEVFSLLDAGALVLYLIELYQTSSN